jgi:hypothetical protein
VLEFGTDPSAFSVTVPAPVPDPWHDPFPKNVYVTVPVAVTVSDVATVAVSYALDPVDSVPAHGAFVAASNTVVEVVEVPPPTVNGSHALVDPE